MEGHLDEVRVILKYEQDYFFRPNHFPTCPEFNCNLTNWWIWSWRICTMTTRVVDLMMMMIRWSWWIQGGVDLDDLQDDDHWQEGGLTCQQAASQPNTQVLTRPSTEGADTEQYTQYTEVLTRPPLMNTINTNPTPIPWYQSTTYIKIAHFWCTKQPECQNQSHTHVLLSNTNNRECFDPSDSQYKRRTKQYNVACCQRWWPHLP